MSLIEVNHLTKDYKGGKGIFDVSFNIEKGEMFGYVGTNGAGKTTTIRHMLGFIKPDSGTVRIDGLDPWKNSAQLMKKIGYIPGEIAFPDLNSGTDVIKSQAEFLDVKDLSYANSLIKRLQLDIRGNPRSMSKGMKQKLAIVLALMHNPEILLLDEPTTGLDPLMRASFMELIAEEHKKGKTILMSSHMYEELEEYSDKVGLIVNGKILDVADMEKIKNANWRLYKVEFQTKDDYDAFLRNNHNEVRRKQEEYNQATVKVEKENIQEFLKELSKYNVKFFREIDYNLEMHFKEILNKNQNRREIK